MTSSLMTDWPQGISRHQFWGTADLLDEGDFPSSARWEGGRYTPPRPLLLTSGRISNGSNRAQNGISPSTVLQAGRRQDVEEVGLDDGVSAVTHSAYHESLIAGTTNLTIQATL